MEYDVYDQSRGLNIPCQGYKGMTGMITKYVAHKGDLSYGGT